VYEFKLPDLGEGIHEGELLKWHVAVGDVIEEDAALVDVETDKAAVTIPSPRGGKVVALEGKPGDTLHVGAVIARIDDGSGHQASPADNETPAGKEAAGQPEQNLEEPQAVSDAGQSATSPAAPSAPSREGRRVPAAPATRRLARERGVDIGQVPATGPGGRVTREDVERFATGGAPAVGDAEQVAALAGATGPIPYYQLEPLPDFSQQGEVETEPVISIRRKVARKMVTSMVVVPHVAHMDDADVTTLENFRREERRRRGDEPGARLSLLPFVVKAVVECLREFPMFNASLDPQRELIVYKKFYNVGFAADTPRGLVVPVIEGADRKSVLDISAEILELAVNARDGSIDASALRGGTFTITNVGPLGGTRLVPTINYPEVAILGMGRAAERAVVRDGEIVIRTILPLTLAFDHRVADGADAARFVNSLVRRLEHPLSWLVEKRG
jgi:pyruvate dehydrogenase E2 component (dihydrolipoamide acetyltransferase)